MKLLNLSEEQIELIISSLSVNKLVDRERTDQLVKQCQVQLSHQRDIYSKHPDPDNIY
jgi:hypothetical protein